MKSDDVSDLFAAAPAGPAPASSMIQGQLVTYSPNTGNNTVLVGTTTLTNVPILVSGAEIGLAAGNNVLLAQIGYTYTIMGKIATPGSASFGSASAAVRQTAAFATGFAVPVADTAICAASITIPSWANTVGALGAFTYSAKNNFGSDTDMDISMVIDGESPVGGHFPLGYGHNGSYNGLGITHSVRHTVTPGGTFSANGVISTTGGFAADANNRAQLTLLAVFTKT